MDVILVSHGFQPDYEAGFANGLARCGVKVTLVASNRTLFTRLSPGIDVINLRGAQDESRAPWKKVLNLLWYLARLLLLVARRRSVTHLTGLFALSHIRTPWADRSWALECRILKLLSRRLLLTVHNVVPHNQDTPTLRARLSAAYRIPHRLIVHTARARQRLIDEFGVEAERIVVMEHGIDEIVVPQPDSVAATRALLGVAANEKLVLCFGIVQRYKGVDLLVEAARHLDANIRIHIAGRCYDPQYQREIERALDGHPLIKQISWENVYLSEDRVSDLLSASDVLAMPYRHIDQSGVLFAAMRHGLPIVAFDVGSLRDYLTVGAGVVVQVGDLEGFASAIQSIEPAPLVRQKIHSLAQRYRWGNTVKPILGEYCQVRTCRDS
jgi:glycosyltransferase involved in cell wall biosynthesis